MKKFMIAALVMTSVVLLFPLRLMILSFDHTFVMEFLGGWNHRIREMIQAEQISYSQGMLLIFNEAMMVSMLRRVVYALSAWLLVSIAVIAGSLNARNPVVVNFLLLLAIVVTAPLLVVPVLLLIALILYNRTRRS
ncbi:hypothetical protein [Macrococcus carouselicus]|uniref:Uncharacterized protein n=1 Tax=Macrococcus carouselicus TaxID=69969 RepID=A0A9Q8CI41_9STAP|nr:hypothetical protein [Macrococcus carouselicus]TDM03899.1 hypothetical protein ERX40_01675 [Macrococcus carouselicus]